MTAARALVSGGEEDDSLGRSFEAFARENYDRLLRFLLIGCADRHLAEDALQEALIIAMNKWTAVSRHRKPVFWVRKAARYELLSLLRKRRPEQSVGLDGILDGLPDCVIEPGGPYEVRVTFRDMMDVLTERERWVIALVAEDCTDDEIAAQLDLLVTTVRTYKCDARRKLRKLRRLNEDGAE